MRLAKFAFLTAALVFLTAQTEPAVQPGGDIPVDFKPTFVPPIPPGGDIPKSFKAPRGDFQYDRRTVMIPMRDGVKLYAVLIVPKGVTKAPIMLDRTPYSADKATSRNGQFGPWPENILSALDAELVRAGYIVAVEDVRGKYKSEGEYVMNRPLRGSLNPTRSRPFDRRLGHHRLAGEERPRSQRPRRHHRHQLQRLHRADEPGQSAPRAQGRRSRSTRWSTCGRATTGSTTAPSARK